MKTILFLFVPVAALFLGGCTTGSNASLNVLSWVEIASDGANLTKSTDVSADVKANTAVGAEAQTGADSETQKSQESTVKE